MGEAGHIYSLYGMAISVVTALKRKSFTWWVKVQGGISSKKAQHRYFECFKFSDSTLMKLWEPFFEVENLSHVSSFIVVSQLYLGYHAKQSNCLANSAFLSDYRTSKYAPLTGLPMAEYITLPPSTCSHPLWSKRCSPRCSGDKGHVNETQSISSQPTMLNYQQMTRETKRLKKKGTKAFLMCLIKLSVI